MRVEYRIDARDRIISVNDDWTSFALANSAGELAREAVLGKPLWEYIADPGTASIYERLFQRVRAVNRSASFTFRCDSASERRLFEMTLTPDASGGVLHQVTVAELSARQSIGAFDASARRSEALVRMCGWCHAVVGDRGQWIELEIATRDLELFHASHAPRVTHTVCPECLRRIEAEIEALHGPPPG